MKLRMRLGFGLLLCAGVCISGASAQTYTPEKGSAAEKKVKANWMPTEDPGLPNVLILGDSISIGYTLDVRERLKGKANVYRPCSADGKKVENCQGTTLGVQKIDSWLGARKWNVIHFNWGLHDLKHVTPETGKNSTSFDDPQQADPATYGKNMTALVSKLKATGAKLIFATTTPYPDEPKGPARRAIDAGVYNNIALKIMKANGIQVNDLYALCVGNLSDIQLPENVHFKPAGRELQGKAVAKVIDDVLSAQMVGEKRLLPNDRVVFFGDSITKGGVRPGGYINLASQAITATYPEMNIKLIGAGVGGNKVSDLMKRLNRDVLQKNPDVVVIYIGINDVWHWTHPKVVERGGKGTSPEDFEAGLKSIIQQVNDAGARVILCTPTVIGEKKDGTNPSDKMLDAFAAISRSVATETGTQLLDLRKAFMTYLKEHNAENAEKGILTRDTVHLNEKGNRFLADLMLQALGVPGDS